MYVMKDDVLAFKSPLLTCYSRSGFKPSMLGSCDWLFRTLEELLNHLSFCHCRLETRRSNKHAQYSTISESLSMICDTPNGQRDAISKENITQGYFSVYICTADIEVELLCCSLVKRKSLWKVCGSVNIDSANSEIQNLHLLAPWKCVLIEGMRSKLLKSSEFLKAPKLCKTPVQNNIWSPSGVRSGNVSYVHKHMYGAYTHMRSATTRQPVHNLLRFHTVRWTWMKVWISVCFSVFRNLRNAPKQFQTVQKWPQRSFFAFDGLKFPEMTTQSAGKVRY